MNKLIKRPIRSTTTIDSANEQVYKYMYLGVFSPGRVRRGDDGIDNLAEKEHFLFS
jgi:hypothetical protein